MLTQTNLTTHLPRTTGQVSLTGLSAPAEIYRDAWGIPHARAASEVDAFYVQGFFTAQDRLWQMEYDRRPGQRPLGRGGGPGRPGPGRDDAPLPPGGQRPG